MNPKSVPLIVEDPETLGGLPVFYGTRVPVKNLIDYLTTGESIDSFLEDFPAVTREQIIEFIERAETLVVADSHAHSD